MISCDFSVEAYCQNNRKNIGLPVLTLLTKLYIKDKRHQLHYYLVGLKTFCLDRNFETCVFYSSFRHEFAQLKKNGPTFNGLTPPSHTGFPAPVCLQVKNEIWFIHPCRQAFLSREVWRHEFQNKKVQFASWFLRVKEWTYVLHLCSLYRVIFCVKC